MKTTILKTFVIAVCVSLLFSACKKTETTQQIDNELITTVGLQFVDASTASATIVRWEDLDGDGGDNPIIGFLTLDANTTYNFSFSEITNASKSPAESILEEIEEKATEHLFYYETGTSDFVFHDFNLDSNNAPLGTTASVTTKVTSSGTLTVTLRHMPVNKSATDLNTIGGSTDIQIGIPYKIQ